MKVLSFLIAAIALIFLIGIYEQLSISNMSPQERAKYEESQLKTNEERSEKRDAALKMELKNKIERENILSTSWSKLESDSEKMTWLFYKWLLPIFLIGFILSAGFNLVKNFHNKVN